jgi:hypothetical protein
MGEHRYFYYDIREHDILGKHVLILVWYAHDEDYDKNTHHLVYNICTEPDTLGEWVFNQIKQHWGFIDVDLFKKLCLIGNNLAWGLDRRPVPDNPSLTVEFFRSFSTAVRVSDALKSLEEYGN